MLGKLRPVGSRVPSLGQPDETVVPWEAFYRTQFMGSGTEALSAAVGIAMRCRTTISEPEIIVPAYGCPDLISAIIAQGAKPVLVDLVPSSPFMSRTGLREAITSSTVAVVGVGFLGIPERLELLAELCRENNVLLIEDAAQCFPPVSSYKPLADFVVLSFGRGKPINLMGGGALLVREEFAEDSESLLAEYPLKVLEIGLAWRIKRSVFNFLLARFPYHLLERLPLLGIGQTRFYELACISRVRVPRGLLSAGVREFGLRPQVHHQYSVALKALDKIGWNCLMNNNEDIGSDNNGTVLRYPVLAPDREARDKAVERLNAAGIGASIFYGQSLEQIEGVRKWLGAGDYPVAREFAARLFTLPTHEDVRLSDIMLTARILMDLARAQKGAAFKTTPPDA